MLLKHLRADPPPDQNRQDPNPQDPNRIEVSTLSGVMRRAKWRLNLPHAEPFAVLLWITKGHARVTAGARARGLGPHSAVFVPAGTPWSLEPGPNTQATLTRLPDSPFAPFPTRARILRVRELERQMELSHMIDAIAHPGPEPARDRVRMGQCVLLSAWLERLLPPSNQTPGQTLGQTPRPTPGPNARANQLAATFAQTVEKHLHSATTLAQIGAEIGVSPTHLSRTTKATCGLSAATYLNDRRMHEARRLLADTDASAAQIARDMGFSSAAYFTRAFGAHAGQTPSAFRAAFRAAASAGRSLSA